MTMSSDDDEARLLAALSLAFRSLAVDGAQGDSFEARLAQLGQAMVSQRWQITVARDLRLSVVTRLARPWHCWKLRQLMRQLLVGNLEPRQEADAVALLTRCTAMVEFGVDVNAAWYRRLRNAVAEGRTNSRELRSLLRCATVWWGSPMRGGSTFRSPSSWVKRLWSMGRPADGELLIAEHHWATRLLLTFLLVLSGFALGVAIVGFACHLATQGSVYGLGPAIVAIYTYGIIFWAAWWFGPFSWSAVRRLREVLQLSSKELPQT
jgi:hypothetical protein